MSQSALKHVGIGQLDRVTGGADGDPWAGDPLAKHALDAATKQYGADRVKAIAQSPERLRNLRGSGYPVTYGYVLGADDKILRWVEGP